MKITASLNTLSRVAGVAYGSTIDRVAHDSLTADIRSDSTRVVVAVFPDGRIGVTTYHLGADATPKDAHARDDAAWVEDVSIVSPTQAGGETLVLEPEHARVRHEVSEALPY